MISLKTFREAFEAPLNTYKLFLEQQWLTERSPLAWTKLATLINMAHKEVYQIHHKQLDLNSTYYQVLGIVKQIYQHKIWEAKR